MIEQKIEQLLKEHDETGGLIRKVYSVVVWLDDAKSDNMEDLEKEIISHLNSKNKNKQRQFEVKTHTKQSIIITVV